MDKGAAPAASPEGSDRPASADVLLRSETFQQRMERARLERARVLAQGTTASVSSPEAPPLPKPWDHQDRLLNQQPSAPHRAKRPDPGDRATAELPARPPDFLRRDEPETASTREARHPATPSSPVGATGAKRPRRFGLRIALGFALGVTAGLALSRLPAILPQPTGAEPVASAPPAAPVAEAAPDPAQAPIAAPIAAPDQQPDAVHMLAADLVRPLVPATEGRGASPAMAAPAPPDTGHDAIPRPEPAGAATAIPTAGGIPAEIARIAPDLPIRISLSPQPRPLTAPSALPAPDGEHPPAPQAAALPPPPRPDAADPTPPLIGHEGLSIHLLRAGDDPGPADAARATLTEAGLPVTDDESVGFKVSQSHLRFYHAGDAEAAATLAALLGVEARDFTARSDPPPPGLIEVWLEGPGAQAAKAAVPAKTKKKRKPAPPSGPTAAEQAEADALKKRLILLLQPGG